MPIKLKDLIIDRVDLVKQGDNPEAHVCLYKNKDAPKTDSDKFTDEDAQSLYEKFLKIFKGGDDRDMPNDFDLQEYLEEADEEVKEGVQAVLTEKDDKIASLEDRIEKLEDTSDKDSDNGDDDDIADDVWKNLPADVRKQIDESKERAEEAEKLAKRLEEEKLNAEYIDKAKEFENIVTKPDEVGPVLKRVADNDKEDYEVIKAVLSAAEEVVAKNNQILLEIGEAGEEGAGDAWNKIEKKAKELMESNTDLTKEKAITTVFEQNPDLYSEYQKEAR